MSVFGYILPGCVRLSRVRVLDHEAKFRLAFISFYLKQGRSAKLTCDTFRISKDTLYRWLKRYRPRNLMSLVDDRGNRRPHHLRQPDTPWYIVKRIIDLRQTYPTWSKYKLHSILSGAGYQVSAPTIGRILKRYHLIDQKISRRLTRRQRQQIARRKAARVMRDKSPGHLVQIDTKHIYFMSRKFYQFTAIDCFTRVKHIQIYTGISSQAGRRFLDELMMTFPFRITGIQTDNGSEYLKDFHHRCEQLKIDHYFTDPYCPKQNGRVERSIQTDIVEYWEQGNLDRDLTTMRANAVEWMNIYNTQRPHQALNFKTPMDYYLAWRRQYGN